MSWIRRGVFEVLASLLLLMLLGTVFAISGNSALSHPEKMKTWFAQSGIYDQVVTNSINSAQNSVGTGADTTAISLKDPEVQKVARSVFSPQLVQQNVETFIDSNYLWLQGKTDTPNFRIDLTQTKQMFAQKAGQSVLAHLSSLTVCTPEQLAQLQTSGTINPLSVACRPANIDPQTEANKVTQQLSSGPFIDQPVITAQTVGSNYATAGSRPYFEAFSNAPQIYQITKVLPYVLGFTTLLIIGALVALSESRRVAARRIGFVFLLSGIILLIIKVVADYLLNEIEHHVFTNQNASQLQQPLTSIAHNVEHSLVHADLISGLICLAVAIALFICLQVTRDKGGPAHSNSSGLPEEIPNHTPEQRQTTVGAADGSTPPKPRRPRLIQ